MSNWYKLESEEVVQQLGTSPSDGLSTEEAKKRLEQYGINELVEKGAKSPWLILLDQFKDAMVIILFIAALVSLFLGEEVDVIIILAIVVLNAVIGFTQEYRAEQAVAALKKLSVPIVKVRRDGRFEEISALNIVPGDIVMLEAGNLVPADGRLLESVNLKIEEAALTGESEAVEKVTKGLTGDHLTLGDQKNMVFMGTTIAYGRGTAVVTETGMKTQLGNIADLIQNVDEEQTPLQKRLGKLGVTLGWVALGIIAIVVVLGLIRGEDWLNLILVGISMAVAAVPEGLPAVVSVTLALGSQRMLKRHALIRRLPAVETLGSVTVICSDKTGTLTQNRMTVTVLDVSGETAEMNALIDKRGAIMDAELKESAMPHSRTLSLLIKAGALCNDAVLQMEDGQERTIGDPTEGALVVAASQMGYTKHRLEDRWPRVNEIPFTSEKKRMTTIHRIEKLEGAEVQPPSEYIAFTKGAVDSLLEIADSLWAGETDTVLPLDDGVRQRILDANAKYASQGQRVLCVAFKPLDGPEIADETAVESGVTIIGLVAMIDPPRPEVKDAVHTAKTAGIRPVMITGDHPLTALNIAQDLGITDNDKYITGKELATMDMVELEKVVKEVSVYARVSPEHKLNIVNALQNNGQVVAMTGDGVNDAPALKRAEIGVAMGITGTDVSKQAAEMVLLDDNFATIVAAVEEGRVIFDNIRKFIKYTLSSNTGELMVMLCAPFLGMPLPLLPLQILWINLVTDGLPGLALAVEQGETGIMERPPFHPKESLFSRGLGWRILWIGSLMGLVSLLVGYFYYDPAAPETSGTVWQTMVFTTLTLAQMGNALAIRSNTDSIFKIGFFSNRMMLLAVATTFILQMALIYVPFLQNIFKTVELPLKDLAFALVLSTVVFITVEIEKLIRRRLARRKAAA
ncbi:MAG: cation-translocating P-type ATPase [Anaerolineae bacterium]|nr:cation-translocating P-type ATPase [Anaerolineae bacterium]